MPCVLASQLNSAACGKTVGGRKGRSAGSIQMLESSVAALILQARRGQMARHPSTMLMMAVLMFDRSA